MFFIASEWIRTNSKSRWKRDTLLFVGLFILLWFSHLAGFVMTLIIISYYEVTKNIMHRIRGEKVPGRNVNDVMKVLVIPLIIPALCTWRYYSYKHTGQADYLPTSMVSQMVWNFGNLTCYTHEPFSYVDIFRALVLLSLPAVAWILISQRKRMTAAQMQMFVFSLSLAFTTLLLCYVVPDGDGSGSYITDRLAWLFYLFIPLVLGAVKLNQRVVLAGVTLFVVMGWKLNREREPDIDANNRLLQKVELVSEQMERGSTFAGFVFAVEFGQSHVVDLAATGNGCLMLNNYENSADYFPVARVGFSITFDKAMGNIAGSNNISPEYVMIVGDYRSGLDTAYWSGITKTVTENYDLIADDAPVKLYHQR